MKKYLLGILAMVFITTTAFTITEKEKKSDLEYLFYKVVNDEVDPNSPLFSEPMTVEEFEQENTVNCPAGNITDCIRAWAPNHTPSPTEEGDYVITRQ